MLTANHRIFVSHSHLDNAFGTKLVQDLRRALTEDSAVFYDVMGGLHGGDSWWNKIVEELTTRDVFLLILSPDAMNSRWVRKEIDIALNQDKLILPVLYQTCAIRADLKIIQIISFLAPKPYEVAFQEILVALHLPVETPLEPKKPTSQPNDSASKLMQQMETAFTEHDWPDVIGKAEYLMKYMPASMTSLVYRWQAVALVEEGEEQQAQDAFQTALALVSNRQERLTLLSDYTSLLVRQHQWAQVLQRATPRPPRRRSGRGPSRRWRCAGAAVHARGQPGHPVSCGRTSVTHGPGVADAQTGRAGGWARRGWTRRGCGHSVAGHGVAGPAGVASVACPGRSQAGQA